MTGKKSIEHQLITIAEALMLSEHIKISETRIALELFEAYTKEHGSTLPYSWELACALTFIYDTGRIQGMREIRAKRKI